MKGKEVKIEEIYNLSIPETVNEVSNRTTQNQREGKGKCGLMLLQSNEEKENASYGDQGNHHKEPGTESSFFPTKDSKSPSCVPHMDKIEEPMNHLYFLIENQPLLNRVLGPLIHKENPETDNKKNPVFSFHHPIIQLKRIAQSAF